MQNTKLTAALLVLATTPMTLADEVINDDLIVRRDACFGSVSCADGDVFGDTDIRIKSSQPQFHFEDTTSVDTDWYISADNSIMSQTGAFAIGQSASALAPFYIESSASGGALVVGQFGDIGMGTLMPEGNLHVVNSGTAQFILESSSNNAKWNTNVGDLGFVVNDVTAGTFPFYMENEAPSASLIIKSTTGNVGLGTESPDAALHVTGSTSNGKILVDSTTGAAADMFQMRNNGGSFFTMSNTASGRDWFFTHENAASGRFIIGASGNGPDSMFYSPNGNMTIGGTLTENSDKNAKMAIVPVDTADVLEKVAALPVSEWTYKDDTSGARHIGPMAQDFHAAFGLGATETGIATLDTSGVALASIKALHAENAALKARVEAQDIREAAREQAMQELLHRLAELEARL